MSHAGSGWPGIAAGGEDMIPLPFDAAETRPPLYYIEGRPLVQFNVQGLALSTRGRVGLKSWAPVRDKTVRMVPGPSRRPAT
jgi:hypothetical protein